MTVLLGIMMAIVATFFFFRIHALEAIDPLSNEEIPMTSYLMVPFVIVIIVGISIFSAWAFNWSLQCGPSALGSTIGAAIISQILMILNTVAILTGITDN